MTPLPRPQPKSGNQNFSGKAQHALIMLGRPAIVWQVDRQRHPRSTSLTCLPCRRVQALIGKEEPDSISELAGAAEAAAGLARQHASSACCMHYAVVGASMHLLGKALQAQVSASFQAKKACHPPGAGVM